MFSHNWKRSLRIRGLTLVTLIAFLFAVTPLALASDYEVELVVPSGKKSKETDAVLSFNDDTFAVVPDKQKFKESGKTMTFESVKIADYSYAKKPMLSGGGAVATALLVGFIFAIPFLFIKKKNHWITVQSEKEFAVIKMKKNNYRAIMAEFETHGVEVNEVKEEKEGK